MKQKFKIIVLLTIALFLVTTKTTQAQTTYTTSPDAENWDCGYDPANMASLAADTSFLNSLARYDYLVNNPPGGNQAQSTQYIVPVVFHMIGTNACAVSYSQIKWQLARLNAAFRDQMTLFNGQLHGSRAVDTQIEFRLACITTPTTVAWTSSSEPGVMKYPTANNTNEVNQIVAPSVTTSSLLAVTHNTATPGRFPFNKYLNIWCVNTICNSSGGCNIIGFGTFPGWNFGGLDGIVMRYDAIGNNSYPTNFPLINALDKGAVLAHEAGHYLGLYHTFECAPTFTAGLGCHGTSVSTSTVQGDLILDTPPTNINLDLGTIPYINSCIETNYPYGGSAQDQFDQLENYMSYSDDDKMNTFTQGQTNRMISAFTLTASARYNLTTSGNLIATGVLPNTCVNNSGLLTAMFNYSIAPNSNCTNVNIQFTNPQGISFSATSWAWTFGDGGTAAVPNPIHTYATSSGTLFTVTCVATNSVTGANTTYTRSISLNFDASIIGQSGTSVCKGSEQTIYIRFGTGVPSVLLTDGTTTVTVPNSMTTSTVVTIPYTFVINASASYSLVPATCGTVNLGSATFSVTECCATLINNGDFSGGISGFNTQLITPIVAATATGHGSYQIAIPGNPPIANMNVNYANMPNITGNAMIIDGFGGNNSIVNIPTNSVTCTSYSNTPIVFQQLVSGLKPNTNYFYSFKIMEDFDSSPAGCFLNFKTSIYNNTLTVLPTQTFTPLYHKNGLPYNGFYNYVVYTYTFATTNTVTTSMTFSLELNQINHFVTSGNDYMIDNVILQEMKAGIQAINSATICKGASTVLTATANCGNSLANYNYAWSPSAGLSSPTTMTTNASPTTTTVYTLVATPTSTTGSNPPIVSTVTITVIPTFTVNPTFAYVYAGSSATLTASGSTGTYSWNPGALTGSVVVVTPTATTVYTVTNATSGTCTTNNTSTVTVSTACSDHNTASYGTSATSTVTIASGTYTTSGQIWDLQGTITFTGAVSFTGYTMRMAPGTRLYVAANATLTLNNCKLFGCTELWYGITIATGDANQNGNIDVKNGTTIEDMYYGIHREIPWAVGNNVPQGFISVTDSKLNKNYYGIQLINVKSPTSGTSYSLTVKNSTITAQQSATSPGFTLKPSTTYTYAYNIIAGGASGGTATYTNFPRAYTGINLIGLSPLNNVVIGDSAGAANTFNTFSNLDFGIYAANAQLRVHNNYFYNLKGSNKQVYVSGDIFNPSPTPIGPDEIGIAVVAEHTVTNTYSLAVGTKGSQSFSAVNACPKSNGFKVVNKAISAKNCNVLIVKGNFFDGDTTDIPPSVMVGPGDNTYNYYKAQAAIWNTALSAGASLNYNIIKNYNTGMYSSHTMSVSTGAYVSVKQNNIQSLSAMGYCKQAISLAQVGGANIPYNMLEVANNTLNKVYTGVFANAVLGGLYIHAHTTFIIDNVKTLAKASPSTYSHYGINLQSTQGANIISNTISSIYSGAFNSSNAVYTNAVYLKNSYSGRVTCNSVNNVGRAFTFEGTCTNAWLTNTMTNSYQGLELRNNGVIGTQGAASSTLAANTWSIIAQETYVVNTNNANSTSNMFVAANGTYTTAPSLNAAATPTQAYVNAGGMGIDVQSSGTPYNCAGGGLSRLASSNSVASTTNDDMYSSFASSANTDYTIYPDEFMFQNQQLLYKLQQQGVVSTNATPQLLSFYNSHNNGNNNIAKFTTVQAAIDANQPMQAQSQNNGIVPINTVQQKTKRITQLMLKLSTNPYYSFTSTEQQDIISIARECVLKGWYVAQARNILNALLGQVVEYDNDCDDNKVVEGRIINNDASTTVSPAKQDFVIYPNPNNGSMVLSYNLGEDKEASMDLYDVTGKLINSYELQNTIGQLEINQQQLQNGIYFYRILVKGKIINTNKIVIIK